MTTIGPDAITWQKNRCWDVLLNESLLEAVIELPVVAADGDEQQLRLDL